MHFKPALSKKYLNIALLKKWISKEHSNTAPSKNVFQKHMLNCSLKIAPSKNAFQNSYKLSIGKKNQNFVGAKTLDM